MADRFIDFDAARAEREKEPVLLRAYGMDFELPAALPAALVLDIMRLEEERGSGAEVSARESERLLRRIIPASVLDTLLEQDDFSLPDLQDLLERVMHVYTGGAGNSAAPNRAARRHPPKAAQSRGNSRAPSASKETQSEV